MPAITGPFGLAFVAGIFGLGGSLIGLAGVWLTLRHERKQRRQDHEFSVKQAAFLQASEAINQAQAYILSLPDRRLPTGGETDKALLDFGAAINRLHLILRHRNNSSDIGAI